jgi:NagD protein
METVLVLTGISTRADAQRFAYCPSRVVDSIGDLELDLGLGGLA